MGDKPEKENKTPKATESAQLATAKRAEETKPESKAAGGVAGKAAEKPSGGPQRGEKEAKEKPRFAPRSNAPMIMEEVGKRGSKREFVPARRPHQPQEEKKKKGVRRQRPGGRFSDGARGEKGEAQSEFTDRLVSINRVAKVVKGGRRFGFSALVVVGDNQGRVGLGTGKAKEITEAVRKATEKGKRKMVKIMLREGRTLHHDIIGHYGSGRVVMRAAASGTGIIAGGPIRSVFEVLGVKDVVAKSIGSSNPHNMVKAAFAGLRRIHSPRSIAAKRGLVVSRFFGHKGPPTREAKSSAESSVKESSEAAAGTSGESSVKESSEAAAGTSGEVSAKESGEAAAGTSGEVSAKESGKAPAEESMK